MINTRVSSKRNGGGGVQKTAVVAAVGSLFAGRVGHRRKKNGKLSLDRKLHHHLLLNSSAQRGRAQIVGEFGKGFFIRLMLENELGLRDSF